MFARYTSVGAVFAEVPSSGCAEFMSVLVKLSVRMYTGDRGNIIKHSVLFKQEFVRGEFQVWVLWSSFR